MAENLAELLRDLVPDGQVDRAMEISAITIDSRTCVSGCLFAALPGSQVHGIDFADKAVALGAQIVLSDVMPPAELGVPVIIVEDVRRAFAILAGRFYQPQPRVHAGVTGTNGKTSVAYFLRQIWQVAGKKSAAIGTTGIVVDKGIRAGTLTTPDAGTLHGMLRDLALEGIDYVALEASSHGIEQRRMDGVQLDVVAFTNLTRDHLDYHKTFEAYELAKLRLFNTLLSDGGSAVVNIEVPESADFIAAAQSRAGEIIRVGRGGAEINLLTCIAQGFTQNVSIEAWGKRYQFVLPLAGEFQVSNALVALGMAVATGIEVDVAVSALETLKGARGRLELIGDKEGAPVFVDYSHTPDSLETALKVLRPYVKRHLIVVFGAGGDRDKGKRGQMGAVARAFADRVIVTDDNPRREDAGSIRAAILAHVPDGIEIGDRGAAIARGIELVGAGDVLLIAGKGHETYQIVGTQERHFSDIEEVEKRLNEIRSDADG